MHLIFYFWLFYRKLEKMCLTKNLFYEEIFVIQASILKHNYM